MLNSLYFRSTPSVAHPIPRRVERAKVQASLSAECSFAFLASVGVEPNRAEMGLDISGFDTRL